MDGGVHWRADPHHHRDKGSNAASPIHTSPSTTPAAAAATSSRMAPSPPTTPPSSRCKRLACCGQTTRSVGLRAGVAPAKGACHARVVAGGQAGMLFVRHLQWGSYLSCCPSLPLTCAFTHPRPPPPWLAGGCHGEPRSGAGAADPPRHRALLVHGNRLHTDREQVSRSKPWAVHRGSDGVTPAEGRLVVGGQRISAN